MRSPVKNINFKVHLIGFQGASISSKSIPLGPKFLRMNDKNPSVKGNFDAISTLVKRDILCPV
jgi:hypothetical protein